MTGYGTPIPKVVLDFMPQLQAGKILCLLPVPRIEIEREALLLGRYRLLPRGSLSLSDLRVVSYPKQEFETIKARNTTIVEGQQIAQIEQPDLTWFQSGATQITPEDLEKHALMAFVGDFGMDALFDGKHEDHKRLIADLSSEAERALDTVRFDFCRLDLPQTLPGRAGTLGIGSSFSTALFYDLNNHESYVIGCEIVTHLIACGVGLEFEHDPSIQSIGDGQVGHIIRRALAMLSETHESSSETEKFMRGMSTLEFIAGGGDYMKMQKVKTQIAAHCAMDKKEYQKICEHFRMLTSLEDNEGKQVGYRTQIVHMGKQLGQIMQSDELRKLLFLDLQRYICKPIHDMLKFSSGK